MCPCSIPPIERRERARLPADLQVARNTVREFAARLGEEFERLWKEATGEEVPEGVKGE